jgi:hypothetical protein
VICAVREADSASAERAWHLLDHLQSPDAETRAEEAIQGMLSKYLRDLIEVGVLEFMEGVSLQEQQSVRVHLRRADGMRLLAQLLAAFEETSPPCPLRISAVSGENSRAAGATGHLIQPGASSSTS